MLIFDFLYDYTISVFFAILRQRQTQGFDRMRTQLGGVQMRYSAAVDVIAERDEEIELLRSEMEECKSIFR